SSGPRRLDDARAEHETARLASRAVARRNHCGAGTARALHVAALRTDYAGASVGERGPSPNKLAGAKSSSVFNMVSAVGLDLVRPGASRILVDRCAARPSGLCAHARWCDAQRTPLLVDCGGRRPSLGDVDGTERRRRTVGSPLSPVRVRAYGRTRG